jgi:hypothetical protein
MQPTEPALHRTEGFAQLLTRPGRCRVRGHIAVQPSTAVLDHHQYIKEPEGDSIRSPRSRTPRWSRVLRPIEQVTTVSNEQREPKLGLSNIISG